MARGFYPYTWWAQLPEKIRGSFVKGVDVQWLLSPNLESKSE